MSETLISYWQNLGKFKVNSRLENKNIHKDAKCFSGWIWEKELRKYILD